MGDESQAFAAADIEKIRAQYTSAGSPLGTGDAAVWRWYLDTLDREREEAISNDASASSLQAIDHLIERARAASERAQTGH
jgi:hypothetical protein